MGAAVLEADLGQSTRPHQQTLKSTRNIKAGLMSDPKTDQDCSSVREPEISCGECFSEDVSIAIWPETKRLK
jgi:hypothetical protein